MLNRSCYKQDHHDQKISDICIYPECNLESRWVCIDCMKQQIHQHGQNNPKHILNPKQSVIKLKQDVDNIQKEDLNELGQRIKKVKETQNQIIIITQENLKILEKIDPVKIFRQQSDNLNELIEKIQQKGYIQQFSNEDIDLLVGKKINLNTQIQESINQIIGNLDEYIQKIRDLNQNKIEIFQKIEDYQYNNIVPVHKQNTQISCAALSYDEQIFAYVTDKKLILMSPFSQLKHIIDNSDIVTCCQFTQCSKYLIYGDIKGKISRLPINLQNMGPTSIQVCKCPISSIVYKNCQDVFISNQDNQIIKIILDNQKYLFQKKIDIKIDAFDYSQSINVIALVSDKTIQIRDGEDGNIIMTKTDSHQQQINQIMITSNLLFTLDQELLKIWNIDNKTLNQQHQISTEQQIFNFSLINDKNILLICKDKIIIKDFFNNQLGQCDHSQNIQRPFFIRQPRSLQFLMLIQSQIFFVFKGQNQLVQIK